MENSFKLLGKILEGEWARLAEAADRAQSNEEAKEINDMMAEVDALYEALEQEQADNEQLKY